LFQGSSHHIAGVVVTEPLSSAQCLTTGETICADDPMIGVNRLWTHPTARKRGIASEILDVIRNWYFTGVIVPRNRIAFSDPTDVGKKFAEHYIRAGKQMNCSILVYRVMK
ncbi:hypothetical protein COOONC_24976, partial [Cooperia oncophora]